MSKLIEDHPVTATLVTVVIVMGFMFSAGSISGKALDQVSRNRDDIKQNHEIAKQERDEIKNNNKERDNVTRSIERKVDRILILIEAGQTGGSGK